MNVSFREVKKWMDVFWVDILMLTIIENPSSGATSQRENLHVRHVTVTLKSLSGLEDSPPTKCTI